MKIFDRYFERNPVACVPDFRNDPEGIVIIPVSDDPEIFRTVESLRKCNCALGNVGVILLVNHSEECSGEIVRSNRLLAEKLREVVAGTAVASGKIVFEVFGAFGLPRKFAGVGLARKMAMDAAALCLYRRGRPEAPILSLDADTLVEENYTDAVLDFFRRRSVAGVSVAYAHRLEECGGEWLDAAVKYELYLRYYQSALAYTGHPHAFHCMGSAFAVRASDYVAEGGMNKRQAGEDFYFLQKLMATGRYACLDTTRVYPSARLSSRTPFGTGRSVRQIIADKGSFPVYRFQAFRDLNALFSGIPGLYRAEPRRVKSWLLDQAEGVREFMELADGEGFIAEANGNSASRLQFVRRFYDHFNAFRVLKYLNRVHGRYYHKADILEEIKILFRALGYPHSPIARENLDFLRNL